MLTCVSFGGLIASVSFGAPSLSTFRGGHGSRQKTTEAADADRSGARAARSRPPDRHRRQPRFHVAGRPARSRRILVPTRLRPAGRHLYPPAETTAGQAAPGAGPAARLT